MKTESQSLSKEDFADLLDPMLDSAYNVALRMTRNQEQASDLVQEAVFHALRGLGTFTPGTNFRAWFFRILTNAYLKSRRGQVEIVDLGEAEDLILYDLAKKRGLDENPAQALMDSVAADQVQAAIERLPEEFRVTLALYLMNDISYEEIALAVDSPIGTVRSRIHRGRKLLQRELSWWLEGEST